MQSNKHAAALVAVLVAFAGFVLAGPTATAHTCAAYEGCDASNCPDGEDHDHTDKNYFADDEHCSSTSKPPRDPESCDYFGITWPPIICRIIEEGNGGGVGGIPEAPAVCDTRWTVPDLGGFGDVCAQLKAAAA